MHDMYSDIFGGEIINKNGTKAYAMGKREEFFDQIILGLIDSAKPLGFEITAGIKITAFAGSSQNAYSLMTFDKICVSIIYNMSLQKSYFENFCKMGLPKAKNVRSPQAEVFARMQLQNIISPTVNTK